MTTVKILENFSIENTVTEWREVLSRFKEAVGNHRLIIYGASLLGKAAVDSLQELGIETTTIIDKNAENIKNVNSILVQTPTMLKAMTAESFILVAASVVTSKGIISELVDLKDNFTVSENGEHIVALLQCAACAKRLQENRNRGLAECGICGVLDNHCPVYKKRGEATVGPVFNDGKIRSKKNTMIGYALGKVCSLNCQHCCESIPQYTSEQRQFVDTTTVIKDIKRLASVCEYITKVEFIGGEPFMHKGLSKIIDEVLKINNVAFVQVFTNGTIIPDDNLLNILKNERVSIHISEYTHVLNERQKANLAKLKTMFEQFSIDYVVGVGKKWYDFSSFEFRGDSSEKLSKRYNACFLHWCNRLSDGKLFVCPHHYAGVNLGSIPENADIIKINELDDEQLAEAVDAFKSIDYAQSCNYCRMPYDAPIIVGAKQ